MEKNSNSKKSKKKSVIFILCSLFFVFCFLFIWQGIYLPKDKNSDQTKTFLVRKGEGSKEISVNLEKEGLIKSSPLFRIYVLIIGKANNLQAGEYLFSPSMTLSEIVRKLVLGDIMKEKITIIEGWNLRNIGAYFEEKGKFKTQDFFQLAGFPPAHNASRSDAGGPKDFSSEFDFLKDKPKNLGLEGYLFPDTYEIGKGESPEDIVRKMLKNFDKKLTAELKEEISRQKKTLFEIITMASMLEKEVRSFEDKKLASGILWKRLKTGMPLQVDATVGYITGKEARRVSLIETRIDSPYNTYKYRGLPSGPISNPGLESVLAALYAENSGYWYYISTAEGETIFSKTFQEHNLAIGKYLR